MPIFAQFFVQMFKNFIFTLLNSELTGPMFTKFSHDGESLLLLLLPSAFTKRYKIPFWNARARSEGDQFRRLQTATQN